MASEGGERRSSGSGRKRRSSGNNKNKNRNNNNSNSDSGPDGQSKSSQRRYFQRKRRPSRGRGPDGAAGRRADEKKFAARARRRRRRGRDHVDEPIMEEPVVSVANDIEDYVEPNDVYVYTHVVRPYYQDSYEFRGDRFVKQGRQIEDYHIDISSLFREDDEDILKDPFEIQPIDLSEPVADHGE